MNKIEIPGYKTLNLQYLVLDYNGTIATDGEVPQSVKHRLQELSDIYQIFVLTADTHGNAEEKCKNLPVELKTFPKESAMDEKRRIVEELGSDNCICLGNGRNDGKMFEVAALSVCIMGPEGAYGSLIAQSDLCVMSIEDGLDLLLSPKRIIAGLRG